MGRRNRVAANLIQVDVAPLIKRRCKIGAERGHGGNMTEYVRKLIHQGLIRDGLLTPEELGMALAGLEFELAVAEQ
jgi:hypothetical protein